MWTNQISPIVTSRVKFQGIEALKTKYPDLNYTTSDKVEDDPKFPSVYIHELPGGEQGQDLEGATINAVLSAFQIDVTDNVSQARVNNVMTEVIKSMKSMRYEVIAFPEFNNSGGVYRASARFRRVVGQGDIL